MLLLSQVIFVAGALALSGALVFDSLVVPRALAGLTAPDASRLRHVLRRWVLACLGATLLGLLAWTLAETVNIAGSLGRYGTVLADTLFGQVALLQGALLAATALALALRPRLAPLAALLCVAAQAAHGHGMAIGGIFGPLFQLELFHLLAAGVWIGGLPPLLLVVARGPVHAAAIAARWFSPIGKWAVLLLLLCALIQSATLLGSTHALLSTAYGRAVLAKAALFCALFGLAVLNRYRLAPALRTGDQSAARRRLLRSIAAQTLLAALAVTTACYLGSLPPPAEMQSAG